MEINSVKGVILAGGEGAGYSHSRSILHKTLLPLYDKPVIDYALGTMRDSGIKRHNHSRK